MAAPTRVYTKANPNGETGTLFQGKKFWLSLNIPQRQRFRDLIQVNGGTVVLHEKDADIKLVDHTKRDIPLDTYSFKYVEKSIQNGRLEDLAAHRAGKSSRTVGARDIPTRHHRVSYTLEDDQILWDWLQPYEAVGAGVSGRIIYQQLAQQHPQHTDQSWRDRYLKRLRGSSRPGGPRQDQAAPSVDNGRPTNTAPSVPTGPSQSSSAVRIEVPRPRDLTHLQPPKPDGQIAQPMKPPYRPGPKNPVGTSPAQNGDQVHTFPSQPRTPIATDERPISSQRLTITAAQAETPHFPTTRPPGKITMVQDDTKKRKRLSEEILPTIPRFAVDELASRKRRATDFITRLEPSTPDQSLRVRMKVEEDNDQAEPNDDTNSIEFETAPQFPSSSNAVPSQSQPWATDAKENELNVQAFIELPFPPASSDSGGHEETTHEVDDDEQVARQLDDWIADRLRTGKAKSEQHLVTALACTSMDPEVADRVLDFLAAGKGIPQSMAGVWTDEDDATLEGTDARGIERLLKKHGTKFYNERFKYLTTLREAQM